LNSSLKPLLLDEEKGLLPAFRAAMSVMFMAVSILLGRVNLNSRNSSKPPSSDPNREKKRKSMGLKRGGQQGHIGTTLKQVDVPMRSKRYLSIEVHWLANHSPA